MEGQKYHYQNGQLFNVTLSDSTEAVFQDSYGISGYCTGFHVTGTTDGTVSLLGTDASSDTVSMYLKRGEFYPYSVRKFLSTGATPGMSIIVVR